MNRIHRYLYWNMNYHVEHHMFPLVPYHALPKLHAAVKDDCAPPYPSLFSAWREIVPTILRQVKDPGIPRQTAASRTEATAERKRLLPRQRSPTRTAGSKFVAAADLGLADVIRFDHGKKTYALYRDAGGRALRHRRSVHPRQHSSFRRPGEGQHHRVLQAQWALQP